MTIMTPVIFIINLFSRGVMRLMRVDPDAADKAMTEEELRTIVDVSHEDGVIESDEKEMIYNVFDLEMPQPRISWFQEYMLPLQMWNPPMMS